MSGESAKASGPSPRAGGGESSREEALQSIRRALSAHQPLEVPALPGRTNHMRAGVLVPGEGACAYLTIPVANENRTWSDVKELYR